MTTVREGNKSVLLVVDVQVHVMDSIWEADRIIDNINRAVEKARNQGVPVIWVYHTNKKMTHGSPDWALVPPLVPEADEIQIDKHYNSAFEQTSLEETLARLDVSHIVLCGAATNWCIRATAYAALDKGYDLTLIKDAHTTEDLDLGDEGKVKAVDIILDLNAVMNWVSYPDRTNRSVAVNELDFKNPS